MGICSGKILHHSGFDTHSRCDTEGFRDCDTVQLLHYDRLTDRIDIHTNVNADEEDVFEYNFIPQPKQGTTADEEDMFEYNFISQPKLTMKDKEEDVFEYTFISRPKQRGKVDSELVGRNITEGGDLRKSRAGMKLASKNDDKVIYVQPAAMDLNVYVVTWNMNGKALVRSVAKLLEADGVQRYDLYVIGLQESHDSVALPAITEVLGEKYSFVAAARMLSLQVLVIAKTTVLPFLSRPLIDKVSTGGFGGLAGRQKGAVAVTFRYKEASLVFIVCHLAPHQGNVRIRNAQYRRISQAVFARQAQVVPIVGYTCPGCSSCKDGHHRNDTSVCERRQLGSSPIFVEQADVVVWMGDLNYRVEMSRNAVIFFVKHKLQEVLWSKDQLTRALRKGQAFIGFKEGQLSFRPTYKYDLGTDTYDTSSKERVPSWTDRILYKVGDSSKVDVNLTSYDCINSIKTSDHRPVKALFRLSFSGVKYS